LELVRMFHSRRASRPEGRVLPSHCQCRDLHSGRFWLKVTSP